MHGSSSGPSIAIVGMGCVYPDARTPGELWENVLAQRRAFRRLPRERLPAEDYVSADRAKPDASYAAEAAVIEGYEFDRLGFRVAGSTFRAADMAHWLALDVAAKALADAGFGEGRGLPKETTGVLVGNTLTGEFSRASAMRLRWPYVRRVVESALAKEGWDNETREGFLQKLEADYKAPFEPVGEETLAGALSNTIAGRICNHFDLKGGGYTVDGACASSLLAIANGCSGLHSGDLDVAIAGGVDLSLDPFELVGFAKAGALATDEMRVFDRRSAGFWPGEGCGFVVLMRHQDALAQGCRVYAVIRGWGISSDGSGGITRPEAAGQMEAIRRAYRRAGFGCETVGYCEGHGTGTSVGDATELEVLGRARREAHAGAALAVVGSIKANIGHTKAAAGVAGLIKATMAVHTQVLPPTSGCGQPAAGCAGGSSALKIQREVEIWPEKTPLRASVSAMGFGGINTHVVLESCVSERRRSLSVRERSLSHSCQDAEVFLFAAKTEQELRGQIERVLKLASRLSRAELGDLAARLEVDLKPGLVRAAVVASTPMELDARLGALLGEIEFEASKSGSAATRCRRLEGVFFGRGNKAPRIAFLFPGQGTVVRGEPGIWSQRFVSVRKLIEPAGAVKEDEHSTRVMQPATVAASLAGLRILDELGVQACTALGHSLGEITGLHWAGVLSEEALLRIAQVRGAAMADLGSPTGAMLAMAEPAEKIEPLLNGDQVWIVGYNSPRQTVVAGQAAAIERLAERAAALGWQAARLPVSHAFHTPLVAAAAPLLVQQLQQEDFARSSGRLVSSITGRGLDGSEDLRDLLSAQVTSPVLFARAFRELMQEEIDLLVEVGSGAVLSGLARDMTDVPVIAMDVSGNSLRGLLEVVAAAFVLGSPVRHKALFADRFTRPFSLDWKPRFFENPCEKGRDAGRGARGAGRAERGTSNVEGESDRAARETVEAVSGSNGARSTQLKLRVNENGRPQEANAGLSPLSPLTLIRQLVAQRAELPVVAVEDRYRMLSDLHLNSITVGQIVAEAARQLSLPRIVGLTDFANATVSEIGKALEDLKKTGIAASGQEHSRPPAGVDSWVENFTLKLVEVKRAARRRPRSGLASKPADKEWKVFALKDNGLVRELRARLEKTDGRGVLVYLPEQLGEEHFDLLLEAARTVMALQDATFALVQHGWGGAGFVRTLQLETRGLNVCIVNVPADGAQAAKWVLEEIEGAAGYCEAHYDARGKRFEPRLARLDQKTKLQTPNSTKIAALPLGKRDTILVTGGGKGIAAECALALGRESGAALILMGRSDPKADQELARNLERIAGAGLRCTYVRADVTDAAAVRRAIAGAEKKFGRITAFLHGAGTNTPQLIAALDRSSFQRTFAPKIQGACNVLSVLQTRGLKLFVTFGSIIARTGMPGEGDYAMANEWLTALTERFQKEHQKCRCLALEWSVWSGIGMGDRLGRLESLANQGITAISPDDGVRHLLDLLRNPPKTVAVIVAGRFGEPPALRMQQNELPLQRFLERKRVYYPGVELVVDATLSLETDPYLQDHALQKEPLFPAVLGLEAMAQAAQALAGTRTLPVFEQVKFVRPIAIGQGRPTCIRIAALRRAADLVEVVVRSEETDFHVEHFRALCRFQSGTSPSRSTLHAPCSTRSPLPLDPCKDLYGSILFHKGRFQRLSNYQLLSATECHAEITSDGQTVWFSPYVPSQFLLGDPGARDASLHAIQACVPHQRILPAGVEKIVVFDTRPGVRFVRARERFRQGNTFMYDFEVSDSDGKLVERWIGLELRSIENLSRSRAWPRALVGPYLQRRLEELVASPGVRVALDHLGASASHSRVDMPSGCDTTLFLSASERRSASDAAMQSALGKPARVWRRPDGKPVTWETGGISAAHREALTFAIAGKGQVACDVETVIERADVAWLSLLGKTLLELATQVSRTHSEHLSASATRLWTALECLRKAGLPAEAPLVFEAAAEDGWIMLRSGTLLIATCVLPIQDMKDALAFAIAFRRELLTAEEATDSRSSDTLGSRRTPAKDEIQRTND